MAGSTQTVAEARGHAAAVIEAAKFFRGLADRGELPKTEEEFEARVEQIIESFDAKLAAANALLLAMVAQEPCPVSLFEAWASRRVIWRWRLAKTDPLPSQVLNGKIMVKPKDFFRALTVHGKSE